MENQPETILLELIRHNNWANAQVFAACQELTGEQLAATVPGTYGSIYNTLKHIIFAEAAYVGRMMGDRPQSPFKREDQPALAELFAFGYQVAEALLDTARRIRPTHIVHEEEDGQFIDYQAQLLFIQAINHGVEHRCNITTILSSLGLPAPEVDGWAYLFSHPDRFELKEGTLGV